MSGSTFGKIFTISTWGESHGKGLGVVIDGCPAGIDINLAYIQAALDRRRPGTSEFTTKRAETDTVDMMSGVFEGKSTGAPISLIIFNGDQRSYDYDNIKDYYRPGHADYGFDMKYGFRDFRGGGRSSGRETAARVAAGAVAKLILASIGIDVMAYTLAIGPVTIDKNKFDKDEIYKNPLGMPDHHAYLEGAKFVKETMARDDSAGGVVECVVSGMRAGFGDPVFGKLDALLAQGIFSIGAVKGFEIGSGFEAAKSHGSINNDQFYMAEDGQVEKRTNHAGGIIGGISDGSDIVLRAAFKPTSSIAQPQKSINNQFENVEMAITGRHDPLIAPRAVVVVESMTAIVLVDAMMQNMVSTIGGIQRFYGKDDHR